MCVTGVIFSVMLFTVVASELCVRYRVSTFSGSSYEIKCGSNFNPACKFSAKFVTIDPDEIGVGFGDAYFDTNDIDVEMSCEFRPQIQGNFSIAIVSEDANIGNVTIQAEKWAYVNEIESMNISMIILSKDLTSGTKYTCLCPGMTYTKTFTQGILYKHPEALESNSKSASSYYKVPAYLPCDEQKCNDINNTKLEHCYETKTGKNLASMNSEEIASLVSYCGKEGGIRNNWLTETWSPLMKNLLINNGTLLYRDNLGLLLQIVTSKSIAQHVCPLMRHLKNWYVPDSSDRKRVTQLLIHQVAYRMRSDAQFPWYKPDGQDIGTLMLIKGYTKKRTQPPKKVTRKAIEPFRCEQQIALLNSMSKQNFNQYSLNKYNFYAKTYPGCVDTFESSWKQEMLELLFNGERAYFNTKHVSFGMNDDILLVQMPLHNSTINKDKRAKYQFEMSDCSLYIWNITQGIKTYHREKLTPSKIYDTKSRSIFKYKIPKSKTEKYGDEQRILLGCYIKYKFVPQEQVSLHFDRVKKMQFYIKPQRIVLVGEFLEDKRLNGCKIVNHTYIGQVELHADGTCECIMKISQCNPVKTTHTLKKEIDCVKTDPTSSPFPITHGKSEATEGSKTGMIIGLSVAATLVFLAGITISAIYFTRARKAKNEIRVLTLIEVSASEAHENQPGDTESSQFFSTDQLHDSDNGSQPANPGVDAPNCAPGVDDPNCTPGVDAPKG